MRRFRLLILHDRSIAGSPKIPTMYVIHISVVIVIDAIAGDLFRIGPDNTSQVLMIDVHAVVDDSNYDCYRNPAFQQGVGLVQTCTRDGIASRIKRGPISGSLSFPVYKME